MADSFIPHVEVLGIGIDIIEVNRIKKFISKKKDFLERVFTKKELKYCLGKKNQYQRLAVRFAAKEAVWKSLSFKGLALKDIAIIKSAGGRPGIFCKDARTKDIKFYLSLSHSDEYASAAAVAVKIINWPK